MDDERYFEVLEDELDRALAVANHARECGGDPTDAVEIPVARDMADRVENILGIDGVAERVRELEGELSREEAALELVGDFVDGSVGDYETRAGKIEGAVRTAVALLTEGVVAAPIEGIDRVEVLKNDDGSEFVNIYYAGPIRSAGGTAQALSVLVADYARALLGIDEYGPREAEVGRYGEEVALYDQETGLQYAPTEAEATFIAQHMPIMLDGEATGEEEVSGYRDLERVDTNAARGGMCLVFGEGLALKAPKIQRYTRELPEVEWPWLQDLIDGTYDDGDTDDRTAAGDEAVADPEEETDATPEDGGPPRADASKKYLEDLIAGRPVFSHPSEPGGFRLRYGRARNHGHATAGIHPATMHLVDDFLAPGTQIKTERPGKAAGIVPVDTIEGPTVRLANGDVRRIDDPDEALAVRNGVDRILDLGEYLVNYGEFVENNHPLVPASYTVEWWEQEFEAAGGPLQALWDDPGIDPTDPDAQKALEWATEYDAPLHPAYTYLWHDVSVADVAELASAVEHGGIVTADGTTGQEHGESEPAGDSYLVVPRNDSLCGTLESLLVEHRQGEGRITVPDWEPLVRTLGFDGSLERSRTLEGLSDRARTYDGGDNAIRAVDELAPFAVRERAPTRVGNRMGRPEKSEERELSPAVHTLFPVGEAGGPQRSVEDAAQHGDAVDGTKGEVEVTVGRRRCRDCGEETVRPRCSACGGVAAAVYVCPDCDREVEPDESGRVECSHCGVLASPTERRTIDLGAEFRAALDRVGERAVAFDTLKGVKGLTSEEKAPEPLEKGILRAKHGVSVFKDGTVRYDMTDLPVTAVRPAELDVTAERFRELGYGTDIRGDPLRHDDQLVELRVQDVVLSDGAAEHMLKTADFVDDLLEQYYGLDPYYELDDREDLVGELVFGMAPHTSAATVGRVVGFTSAAVGYAHPYFHAAKRRNCFHPETKLWYGDEADGWRYESIESFVEERLTDPDEDEFGTLLEELDGRVSVPSLDERGAIVRKPVEAVSKHPAPDHMLRIETRRGRELTVTPDHRMQTYDEGSLTTKPASAVETTDRLVTPNGLGPVAGTEPQPLDLLAEFLDCESIDDSRLIVEGVDKGRLSDLFEDRLAEHRDPLEHTADHVGMSPETVRDHLRAGRIPAGILCALLETTDAVTEFVPADVTLGMEVDGVGIDRFLSINERVATLLGHYGAEGFLREQETPTGTTHRTTIRAPDRETREFIVKTFETELGVPASRENDADVTVSGRLVGTVLDTILDAGVSPHTKRVPQPLFDAPDPTVAAYLRGYFGGDGQTDTDGPPVTARTVSQELKEDVIALLTRLGATARVEPTETVPDAHDDDRSTAATRYRIAVSPEDAATFAERNGRHGSRTDETRKARAGDHTPGGSRVSDGGSRDFLVDPIESIEHVRPEIDATYCLTVRDTHSLIAADTVQNQCDGDEDCVMLLLDGLLNFSVTFLPNQRGGRMDAPLVMSSRIDPAEIDDEAHNVDIMEEYPLEFYEATRELAEPGEVEGMMTIAEETLGTGREYGGFRHTHDTADIAAGPDLSAYKTLGSMEEKMDAQLSLSRKLRAVRESDVAERIIEYHFLPDLLGNLKAFSSQEFRCLGCGTKYRRAPLSGDCRNCGGDVNLTVHEGSVNKYMDTAIRVAEEFGCREYTKQRLEILETRIERIFEDDTNKPTSLGDYM